ncbi:hypothetical protein [Ruminococcus sp.]|uniref:hypothetical protein n=1 Tax=Ruminococcus sp. TaxID=41978 RepID=UPI0025DD435E|nr:hypothetical protein [Ruminococcus sp.]MBQ8965654.1 hypothetical protein [Ruminococcus sp.]
MITIDTWAVIAVNGSEVKVECPFSPGGDVSFSMEETGNCKVGDILSTETGGWLYLEYKELNDLTEEGRRIFWDYIKQKGFRYSFLEKYGFIADP